MEREPARPLAAALKLLCLLMLPHLSSSLKTTVEQTRCGEVRVFIAVSPLVTSKEKRALEVYWHSISPMIGDQISLWDYDPVLRRPNGRGMEPVPSPSLYPETYPDLPAFAVKPPGPEALQATPLTRPPLSTVSTDGLRGGWRATTIQEIHVPSGQLGYTPRCLNHWVTYERRIPGNSLNDTEILASNCLRTRPTWMWDLKNEIGKMSLVDMMIPGTHDSAAYREEARSKLLDRYSVTQDESVLGQLIYGVRYIDLRVGFYPGKDVEWWANHGPLRMQPLLSVLHDVKAFIDNTNEIVILDIQEFPSGFREDKDNRVHLKLVHLLETELGELMAARELGWQASMLDIWRNGRRLIVGYDKEDVLPASRKLWTSVRQFWANAQSLQQLGGYVSRVLQAAPSGFPWAIMAELTLNAQLIATAPTGSLRRLAYQVNREVTDWAEGTWGYRNFNVLAVDFFRSTGVVEAAVKNNMLRSRVETCELFRLMDTV